MKKVMEMNSREIQSNDRSGKKWFLYIEEEHEGPFSREDLLHKIDQGLVISSDYVWAEGMTDWLPVEKVPVFSSHIKDPRPQLPVYAEVPPIPEQQMGFSAPQEPIKPERSRPRVSLRKNWKKGLSLVALVLGGVLLFFTLSERYAALPQFSDVSVDDYVSLKAAAKRSFSGPGSGPRLAVAISNMDPMSPSFYVSGNQKDGTEVEIQIDGVADTLIGLPKISRVIKVTLDHGWAKTPPFHRANGQVLPVGEYRITARSKDGATMISSKKGYFLGGPRDQAYDQKLKLYHDELRQQAQQELAELKQFAVTLEDQLRQTSAQFDQWARFKRIASVSRAQGWNKFSSAWSTLQDQLILTFDSAARGDAGGDLFYDELYQQAHQSSSGLSLLHSEQGRFLQGLPDHRDFELQSRIADSESIIQSQILALKTEIQRAQDRPASANGMPQRLSQSN